MSDKADVNSVATKQREAILLKSTWAISEICLKKQIMISLCCTLSQIPPTMGSLASFCLVHEV